MKIIYLANVRIPTEKAHGLQIIKMCEAFKLEGNEVELVVAKRVDNQLEHLEPFNYYGVENKFPIKKLWLIDLVDRNYFFRSLSVLIQNTSFALSAFFYLLFKRTDIIYSRDEFSLFLLSLVKKNLILELHTFPQSKFFLYRFLWRRLKKIIVITSHLKNLIIEKIGIAENKILVSPDGVDINQFALTQNRDDCRRKLNLPLDKNIVIYTGQLFTWKGVYVLAQASKFLTDKELIVLVGGMEYDKIKLEKFILANNLKNIKIIRHQAPTLMPYWLKAANVLVLPNSAKKEISKFYTSPMKLFEYLASGQPIVASDLPSISEILNSHNAILVKPDEPKALALGIKKALSDSILAGIIAKQAFLDAQGYSWPNRARNILNFIK